MMAARNIREAQLGVAFAGFLKLMLPLLVVIPGIAAYVLNADIARSDDAYPWLLGNFVGPGIKGLVFAALIAPLLRNLDQAFQFIQDFTGYVTPGVVAIFLAGLFWKRATTQAALLVAILTIPLSLLFDLIFPEMPFMNRVGYCFLILSGILIIWTLVQTREGRPGGKGIEIEKGLFKTGPVFNASALIIVGILAALYAIFW